MGSVFAECKLTMFEEGNRVQCSAVEIIYATEGRWNDAEQPLVKLNPSSLGLPYVMTFANRTSSTLYFTETLRRALRAPNSLAKVALR